MYKVYSKAKASKQKPWDKIRVTKQDRDPYGKITRWSQNVKKKKKDLLK